VCFREVHSVSAEAAYLWRIALASTVTKTRTSCFKAAHSMHATLVNRVNVMISMIYCGVLNQVRPLHFLPLHRLSSAGSVLDAALSVIGLSPVPGTSIQIVQEIDWAGLTGGAVYTAVFRAVFMVSCDSPTSII
jgi:hypothetical protein